jgi:glutamyl-tRNA reductase
MTQDDALHPDRPNRYDLTRLTVAAATYRDLDDERRAGLADVWRGATVGDHVLLETCHRVELVSVDPPHDPTPPGVHVVAGRAAVQRVFEVVAGFDSAVVAEEEILGQVRGAFDRALTTHTSGPVLNELLRRALRFGRRVRSHAKPGTDRSLIDPALAWLSARLPARGRVVVVGAGVMGGMAATRTALSDHPVTVVSASAERGGQLLAELRGHDHALVVGALDGDVVRVADGMVIAVRGKRDVLRGDLLNGRTLPVVDLSSPSVVSAGARRALGENLLDLDRLGRITPVRSPLSEATLRRLGVELQAEVDAFVAWLGRRGNADAVATLRAQAAELRRRHLSRLRQRAGLDDGQLAQVESATTALLNELLHGPTVQLRQGGADAATVRRLFELGS